MTLTYDLQGHITFGFPISNNLGYVILFDLYSHVYKQMKITIFGSSPPILDITLTFDLQGHTTIRFPIPNNLSLGVGNTIWSLWYI